MDRQIYNAMVTLNTNSVMSSHYQLATLLENDWPRMTRQVSLIVNLIASRPRNLFRKLYEISALFSGRLTYWSRIFIRVLNLKFSFWYPNWILVQCNGHTEHKFTQWYLTADWATPTGEWPFKQALSFV